SAAAALALTLTACGGGGGGGEAGLEPSKANPVTIKAGFIPVIDVAALYLGDKQGIFAEHGIKLDIKTGQGGAALVPSVVSGEYQFAFSNMVSVLSGRAQGLPLKVIGAGSNSTGVRGKDVTMIRVREDSPIKTAKDLEGRKVAVNTLNSLLQMLGDVSVRTAGGDPSKVQYLEMPFPDGAAALKKGTVDAMVTAEPFDTIPAQDGTRVIASPYPDMAQGSLTTSVYFASEQQIQKNPKLYAALQKAINESLTYAQQHPDEVRAQLAEFTQIEPAIREKVTLPTFKPEIDRPSIEKFVQAGTQSKIISKNVTYDDVVWTAPAG
ncbi:ABC transporter substrate-binding protein, partial [Actinomadura adrarensis]